MISNTMQSNLIIVCKKHNLMAPVKAVVREPYIPFVPQKWNGVLVLAESQNMSKKNGQYVKWLKGHSRDEKIKRLYLKENEVGIQPWDDNSLKLAVEAAFGVLASETAVSNAVLWSQRGDDDQNANPDKELQQASSLLWEELLPVLNPTLVICCGKIAKDVIADTEWPGKTLSLRLPSPSALSRISGMFDEDDLLKRYPEVARVIKKHPEWITGYKKNKTFFTCHAVSLYGGIEVKE